jgi:hypothetical protein
MSLRKSIKKPTNVQQITNTNHYTKTYDDPVILMKLAIHVIIKDYLIYDLI